jgi:hypothetical protein
MSITIGCVIMSAIWFGRNLYLDFTSVLSAVLDPRARPLMGIKTRKQAEHSPWPN